MGLLSLYVLHLVMPLPKHLNRDLQSIDTTGAETLVLSSSSSVTIDSLKTSLPASEPCYAFFAWPHHYTDPPRCEISTCLMMKLFHCSLTLTLQVFIYSCPSSSPVKHRMVYSSGASSVFQAAKTLLASSSSHLNTRKIETSDPAELDEAYLKGELGFNATAVSKGASAVKPPLGDGARSFAKPKGPTRKRP